MTRQVLCALMLMTGGAAAAQDFHPKAAAELRAIELDKAQMAGKLVRAIEMRTTTGAPYSAEATTEFVQVLADGNRIVRRTQARIFRDSEGRVRRENLTPDGTRVESVSIDDPVSGVSLMLDPETKMAYDESRKTARAETEKVLILIHEIEAKKDLEAALQLPPPPPPPPPAQVADKIKVRAAQKEAGEQTTRRDLGQRTIDGVPARGTRRTTVLAAGAIGNEQPIRIVSEEWFSPDLQVHVLTKHSDPRSGDTTYSLSNIVRAEPALSLFDVPADYTVKRPGKRE